MEFTSSPETSRLQLHNFADETQHRGTMLEHQAMLVVRATMGSCMTF